MLCKFLEMKSLIELRDLYVNLERKKPYEYIRLSKYLKKVFFIKIQINI
jgi:hypothetical protein